MSLGTNLWLERFQVIGGESGFLLHDYELFSKAWVGVARKKKSVYCPRWENLLTAYKQAEIRCW
jgi:hypothetical protein